MKVAYVSHSDGLRAGAEISFIEVIKSLLLSGHSVHAILPSEGEITDQLVKMGIPFSVVPFGWWVGTSKSLRRRLSRLKRVLFAIPKFYRILNQIKPDLVLTNTMTIPSAAIASFACRIPHIWYIHEFGVEDHGFLFDLGRPLSFFLIDKLSERILVNSRTLQQRFQDVFSLDKIRVLYYAVEVPIDHPGRPPGPDQSFRVILAGRMTESKRQEDAIRAVALLAKKRLSIQLILLGTPTARYGAYLHKLVEENGVGEFVQFISFTSPFQHILSADVALICSKNEAFARVTLEAMKLGVPVIGSDSGGTPEQIRPGFNGLLYRTGDSVDLASKIECLYHDPALLSELGRNAQRWSNSIFNMEKHTAELSSVFEEIAPPKPSCDRHHGLTAPSGD